MSLAGISDSSLRFQSPFAPTALLEDSSRLHDWFPSEAIRPASSSSLAVVLLRLACVAIRNSNESESDIVLDRVRYHISSVVNAIMTTMADGARQCIQLQFRSDRHCQCDRLKKEFLSEKLLDSARQGAPPHCSPGGAEGFCSQRCDSPITEACRANDAPGLQVPDSFA